jgi:hypothetical protein
MPLGRIAQLYLYREFFRDTGLAAEIGAFFPALISERDPEKINELSAEFGERMAANFRSPASHPPEQVTVNDPVFSAGPREVSILFTRRQLPLTVALRGILRRPSDSSSDR